MIVADLVRVFKPSQEFSIERKTFEKCINDNEASSNDDGKLYLRNELIFRGTKEDYFLELQTQYELSVSQELQRELMYARLQSRSFDVVDFNICSSTIAILDPDGKLKIN